MHQISLKYNKVHPSNFSSLLERKIFFALAALLEKNISPQLDLNGRVQFSLPYTLLGRPKKKELGDALSKLRSRAIKFERKDSEDKHFGATWGEFSFLVGTYYERGNVKLILTHEGYDFLCKFQKSEGYFWVHLTAGLALQSVYAQIWYTIFSQFANFGKLDGMTIEKIVKKLEIREDAFINKKTGTRKNSDMLKYTVFKPIEEINSKTNLEISWEPIDGKTRPYKGFNFKIKSKGTDFHNSYQEKINNHLAELRKTNGGSATREHLEIVEKYNLSQFYQSLMVSDDRVWNKVYDVHLKIESGDLEVKFPRKYMERTIDHYRVKLDNASNSAV